MYKIDQSAMIPLRPILLKLDRPGSHIIFNTFTKQAFLCESDRETGSSVSIEDVLALFEKAWVARYDSHGGEHLYRLTEAGRKASRENS